MGLGAILSQKDDDRCKCVICYVSRGTSGVESNYAATKLEYLAIYWAINYFHSYLYGQCFDLITDHSALTTLFNSPKVTGVLVRWIVNLSEFDFTIVY